MRLKEDFLKTLPSTPGVYRFKDEAGAIVYVGKAKNLRRRLRQYLNAKRIKRHRKMKAILRGAASLEFEICAGEREALLLENELIRSLRPRYNVAGAFSFLYPVVGMRGDSENGRLEVLYTLAPSKWSADEYRFFGAFRSREWVGEGFAALVRLLDWIAHRENLRRKDAWKGSYTPKRAFYRQVPPRVIGALEGFLAGESPFFLEVMIEELVEKPRARLLAPQIQEDVDRLCRFYRHEAQRLSEAVRRSGWKEGFVPQERRDEVFIRAKNVTY